MSYAQEKLYQAIHALAASSAPMHDRLLSAFLCFHGLEERSFPASSPSGRDFVALYKRLTRAKASGDEGTAAATIKQMDDDELREVAGIVVDIYSALCDELADARVSEARQNARQKP